VFRSYGLRTHIWNNNAKSLVLMLGFPVLLAFVVFAIALLAVGFGYSTSYQPAAYEISAPLDAINQALNDPVAPISAPLPPVVDGPNGLDFAFSDAVTLGVQIGPFILLSTLIWFVIAYFGHQKIIDLATSAHPVTREQQPRIWNLLENLCISRGITMPSLRVADSPALNAFASGLDEKQHAITVTTGLIESLDDRELEAVLAHELTHVRNKDVQLLVIAIIFVGIFSFVGEIVFRNIWRANLGRGQRSRRSGGGGSEGVVILIGLAIIAIAWILALVIRFAISRSREYIADAGAVELTKDPDAMASALRKVAGNAQLEEAPAELRAFFLENESVGLASIFASHPPISKRIEALQSYAGAIV
jgi:heat shock protein HtpX